MCSTLSGRLASAKYTIVSRDSKISKTIGYYAGFVILGLLAASLGPTISGLADQTQSRLNEISYLFTARSLGYLLGSLYIGRWFDRMAGHKVMATALLLSAGMAFLVPLIPLLWLLVAVMLLMGIGGGGLDVGGNTLLIWLYRDKVGPYMNALHFFFGLGAFVSPLIIARAVLVSGEIMWGIGYWRCSFYLLSIGCCAYPVLRLQGHQKMVRTEG